MLGNRATKVLVGLDITTSSIKLIELVQSGQAYRVESYAAEPTPPNAINEKAIVDAEVGGTEFAEALSFELIGAASDFNTQNIAPPGLTSSFGSGGLAPNVRRYALDRHR